MVLLIGIEYIAGAQSIAQNERLQWWNEARFGMFIHWGLYAIPASEWIGKEIGGIGEWIIKLLPRLLKGLNC